MKICAICTSIVLTEECNIMVNNEELFYTVEYLSL